MNERVKLGVDGFTWDDLHDDKRLGELALIFDRAVERNDPSLFARFEAYRFAVQSGIANGGLATPEESELLIGVSRHLATFLAQLV